MLQAVGDSFVLLQEKKRVKANCIWNFMAKPLAKCYLEIAVLEKVKWIFASYFPLIPAPCKQISKPKGLACLMFTGTSIVDYTPCSLSTFVSITTL